MVRQLQITRFGDEDYYDEVLEGMWWGWQASREEGEPIGFLQSSGVSQLSGGHPAKLYPIGATPSPFESSTLVYTNPARDGQDSVAVVNKASTGEYEFYPSSNLVDIPSGMHKLYTHPASAEVERLQSRVAEKCDAPVGWIAPDKYRAACESKMKFFKTIKELREQNEKLQARVAELESDEQEMAGDNNV